MNREKNDALRSLASPRFAFGVAAIVIGFLFLGDNLEWFEIDPIVDWWPLVLVLFGLVKLLSGEVAWGLVLTLGGSWILLNTLSFLRLDFWDVAFPLAFIGFGALLVVRALRGTTPAGGDPSSDSVLHANAMMGGLQRTSRSSAFRGGDAFAFMGGCEIDLRGARLAPGGAVIDVVAIWGGVEVWVPEDWDVDCQVMPIMGGVEERLARSSSEPAPAGARPRLVVRGVALMGGVEVANGPAPKA